MASEGAGSLIQVNRPGGPPVDPEDEIT